MIRRFIPLLAIALSACAAREVKPTVEEMDRVEAALQATSCAARLAGWDRHHYYRPRYFAEEIEAAKKEGRPPRSSNRVTSVIQFDLVPAPAGRAGERTAHAVPPHALASADGGLHGAYHLETSELDLAGCSAGEPFAAINIGSRGIPVRLSQPAHGWPAGGAFDYVDERALAEALGARRPVG